MRAIIMHTHKARNRMSVTYQGTIPARRTIFKRQSRWPGVARRLFVLCLVLLVTA